ncbi:hypothetical protein EB810_13230 [Altererythrobacter sp. FM1]|uniref:hypothetical protein n=1 Tax=Tsuneonella flava TaxID=2055955 RepID=UPI000C7F7C78|nr:hypothetical protein [Tsuneonella flava]ROT94041.1 hypothetical protein EB810_13230 [Altererythrobacter sp. FM1]
MTVGFAADPLEIERRLVVQIKPRACESLAGLIFSASYANSLGRTKVILGEIDLELAHPGTIGQYMSGKETRLAHHLGCDPEAIIDRTHPYVDDDKTIVRWGNGTMRRSDLILDRRRIAPGALCRSEHHRSAWSCRHLPFDSSTRELLVDRCAECSAILRWNTARGLGTCEHCGTPVSPASRPRLSKRLAASYRGFADLMSIDKEIRERARAVLAPALAALPQPHLLDLIMGIGLVTAETPEAPGRRRIATLDPYERATVSARGYELLRNWPSSLQHAVMDRRDALLQEGRERELISALKRLTDCRSVPAAVSATILNALPETRLGSRRMLGALSGGILLASEIAKKAGVSMAEVALLRDHKVLPHSFTSDGPRRGAQFEEDAAVAFIKAWRSSISIPTIARSLGAPHYAAHQLLILRELTREQNAGVTFLDPLPRIEGEQWAGWMEGLTSKQDFGDLGRTITLRSAMRRHGGGFKDWGGVLLDLHNGLIAFRMIENQDAPLSSRILVRADERIGACISDDRNAASLLELCPYVSQSDACDILNLDPLQIRPLSSEGILRFERRGKGLATRTSAVLRYAECMIAASEIGFRLGVRNDAVHARLSGSLGLSRVPGGWSRNEVERLWAST